MNKFKIGEYVKSVIDWGPYKINGKYMITGMDTYGYIYLGNKDYKFTPSSLQKIEKTIKDVEIGDWFKFPTGSKYKVFAISELACGYTSKGCGVLTWCIFEELEKQKCSLIEDNSDIITIEGKTYNKEEVEKRLKELKPIA